MKTVFATFNFKTTDLATAERLYIENHVRLTLQLPNLRQYITGLVRPHPYLRSPYRVAFNYFADGTALNWAFHESPAAKPLLRDGASLLRVNRWLELDSEIIVPFESRRPGLRCFILAVEFHLNLIGVDIETAETRYRDYCIDAIQQLADLRHFMISRYQVSKRTDDAAAARGGFLGRNPLRMATLVFDSFQALLDAYHSPAGQQLAKEEEATIAKTRVYRIDATVQL